VPLDPGEDQSVRVRELDLIGDRPAIRAQTVQAVLGLLLDAVRGAAGEEGTRSDDDGDRSAGAVPGPGI
jgi:hypothetical protein